MGVGRGVHYNEVELSNRKHKMWYSKTLRWEVRKLGEVLAARRGINAISYIKTIEMRTKIETIK